MLDRQKIETILKRRFPGAPLDQVAAATNAIVGLDDEWEEFVDENEALGFQCSPDRRETCPLAREFERGAALRLFRRRES